MTNGASYNIIHSLDGSYKGSASGGNESPKFITMKNIALAIAIFVISFILIGGSVQAAAGTESGQYGQYGQYGGGAPSYSIMVDKMVSTGQKSKGG